MFHFLLGAVVGVAGTLYYSSEVRERVMETNSLILQIMKNKVEFKREVYKEIQRMQTSGELEDFLYRREGNHLYRG